jgi:hypothetical protein
MQKAKQTLKQPPSYYSCYPESEQEAQNQEAIKNITEEANHMWQNVISVLTSQIIGQIKLNKLSLSYLSHRTGISVYTLKRILQNNSNSLPITEYLKILLVLNKDFSFRWLAEDKIFHIHTGKEEKKNNAAQKKRFVP